MKTIIFQLIIMIYQIILIICMKEITEFNSKLPAEKKIDTTWILISSGNAALAVCIIGALG